MLTNHTASKFHIATLLSLTAVFWLCLVSPPYANQRCYRVIVNSLADQKEAQSIASEMSAEGFVSVKVEYAAPLYSVTVGDFKTYPEARWYELKLKEFGYSNAKTIAQDAPDTETLSWQSTIKELCYFSELSLDKNKLYNQTPQELDSDARAKALYALINDANTTKAIEAALKIAKETAENDPIRGWAMLRAGYLYLRAKDKPKAEDAFKQVADGKLPALATHRLEAMERTARVLCSRYKKIAGYKAFDELQQLTDNPYQAATCQVEKAGIVMEAARGQMGGGGDLEDCRRECTRVLQIAQPDDAKSRATAELIHLETWFYEDNYEHCIDEAYSFLGKHTSLSKEIGMCRLFLATSLYNQGQYTDAVVAALPVLDLDLSSPDDKFKDIDLKKRALDFLITWAEEQGDNASADLFRDARTQLLAGE
jgi:hypothetical protein